MFFWCLCAGLEVSVGMFTGFYGVFLVSVGLQGCCRVVKKVLQGSGPSLLTDSTDCIEPSRG